MSIHHHRPSPPLPKMRAAAIKQAQDRADREGIPCLVYLQPRPGLPVWYVRTLEEPAPEGATVEFTATPVWALP